jgi:hypothetical protein
VGATIAVASLQPVGAACTFPAILTTIESESDASQIMTTDFYATALPSPYGYPGQWYSYAGPPVDTNSLVGVWWALGAGEANNNGTFGVSEWLDFYSGTGSYGTFYYGASITTGWGRHRDINGCIGQTACTAILLSQHAAGDVPRFVIMSAQAALFDTFFHLPENAPLLLPPMPDPMISHLPGTNPGLVDVEINVATPTEGLYNLDGCDPAEGFKVYGLLVDAGQPPPTTTDRSDWTLLTEVATPLDQAVSLASSCLEDQDFFIATSLAFDSGFETSYLSISPERFICACPLDPGGTGFGGDCITCSDVDGDGYGVPGDPTCAAGAAEDCDDHNPFDFPGAPEVWDATDNNCDGAIDEGLDADGDGIPNIFDVCDDTPAGSGVDPDGCPVCVVGVDADGDGFDPDVDCDDADPSVHPGATDLPGDSIDDDCDGAPSCDPDSSWRTHGEFVRCVAQICHVLVMQGEVTTQDCAALIRQAAGEQRARLRQQRLQFEAEPIRSGRAEAD